MGSQHIKPWSGHPHGILVLSKPEHAKLRRSKLVAGRETDSQTPLCYSRDCFHFFFLCIWTGTIQHLEEIRCFRPHTRVNIGLHFIGTEQGHVRILSSHLRFQDTGWELSFCSLLGKHLALHSHGVTRGGQEATVKIEHLSPGQSQISLNNYPYFCSQKKNWIQRGKKNQTLLHC